MMKQIVVNKIVWLINLDLHNKSYTNQEVIKKIGEAIPGVRLDADFRQTTVPAKVKDAELMKIPYILVVGDTEQKAKSVAVRRKGKVETVKLDKFIKDLKEEIEERK